MTIQYAGKVTKEDYLKSLLLHNQQLKILKWVFGVILLIMVLSSMFLLFQGYGIGSLLRYYYPVVVFLVAFLTFPWWTPYIQVSSYNQPGNTYRNNIFGTIDETGISISSGTVKASFQWSTYIHYRITDEVILLYQGKNRINIFTKSMFPGPEDWDKFVVMIKEKIIKK
jgi:hypothetical protein